MNYDETELALYLALEMETDVIPGAGTCNAESHLFLQNERQDVCEGTIIIEIIIIEIRCLCVHVFISTVKF